jgi:vancomycin resistance protein YoaR
MKRGIAIVAGILGTTVVGGSIVAAQYEPVAAPNAKIGPIPIGGLNKAESARRLRIWWESEKLKEVTLSKGEKEFTGRPSRFGVALDDTASVDAADFRDFWENIGDKVGGNAPSMDYSVRFKTVKADFGELEEFVEKNGKPRTVARVTMNGSKIVRVPEVAGETLDTANVSVAAIKAIENGGEGEIPILNSEKKVPDSELNKITGVVAQFSTRFSEGNRPRSSNIRTAAKNINGLVLAPGEVFSFNGSVGRRTASAGFKEAGVYINGKHDTDIGGGICQVSTTLYNAALLSNLEIVSRASHSLPVPYVPVGRDATVDYGNIDLKIRNSYDFPIALCSTVSGGRITWRVLGQPQPDMKVEVVLGKQRTWDVGTQTIKDPTLAAGRTKVVEGGAIGRSLPSWRVVYVNGKEVKRESLGQSFYRGARRVIAVGTRVAPPAPAATAAPSEGPAPAAPTPVIPETNPAIGG